MAGALVFIHDRTHTEQRRIDIPGSLLSIAGLTGIVYGFSSASTHGWSSPLTYGAIVAGLAALALFTAIERSVTSPLVPLKILADRTRGASYVAMTICGATASGMYLIMTYYFQGVLGYSPIKTGLAILPFIAGFVVSANVTTNVLLAKAGPKIIVPAGLTVDAGAMLWLSQIGVHTSYTFLVTALVLLGLGLGAALVSTLSLGVAGADPADAGVASAVVNAANQVGASIGPSLLNTLPVNATAAYLVVHGARSGIHATVHGFSFALTVMVYVLLAAALVTVLVYRRHTPDISRETIPELLEDEARDFDNPSSSRLPS